MKKIVPKFVGCLVIFSIMMTACNKNNKAISLDYTALDYTVLPTDVKKKSDKKELWVVTDKEFNDWFKSGKKSKDGIVKPANSVDFPVNNTNNDFNKWSQQMFLWITSPKDSTIVLETPEFYTVSPPDSLGKRNLIQHPTTILKTASGVGKSDTEEGQATTNVLLASVGNGKDNSLVYYITYVNDVYAKFLQAGQIDSTGHPNYLFPTDTAGLNSIIAFAKSIGETVKSPNTLAMELKTSWVDLATIPLAKQDDYIKIWAEVPIFNRKSNTTWKNTARTKKTQLGLVGMHVVGSVKEHPEMIWSTFEHQSNSPNLEYSYLDGAGKTQTNLPDTLSNWLFNSKSTDKVYNKSHMKYEKENIIATKNNTISPSNTVRIHAFGNDDFDAEANSEIIAFNNSVRNQLSGDVRENYIFIGAIWTNDSKLPNLRGNKYLANSTMETNAQGTIKNPEMGTNCFSCHSTSLDPNIPFALSHIYSELKLGTIITAKPPIDSKALVAMDYK
jgi:hypothetical protein